jgi:peptidoglycan hydrolase CwlO-like protein
MDQNTLKLITAKIEKTLEQARVLKSEKVDLEVLVAGLRENLGEKDKVIDELKNSKEQLLAEIRSLQEALNERDAKLQESEEGLLQAIETLNKELDIENKNSGLQGLFNMNEGNV